MTLFARWRAPVLALVAVMVCASVAVGAKAAETEWQIPEDTSTIESLTPEQARKLVATTDVKLSLSINGLTTLDTETAKALAELQGDSLYLEGLTTLSPATAKALASLKPSLSLNGLTTLTPEAATALAKYGGPCLLLDGITTLSDETAKALADYECKILSICGLTTLSEVAATALAKYQGEWLLLNGLATLAPNVAKAIAEFSGRTLSIGGLTSLDAETARALAAAKAWNGSLPNITAFDMPNSVEIATILATTKRRLKLPNLRRIPPRAYKALLQNEDSEIPPRFEIAFIPEPEGYTDDFIAPEGYEQKR